MHYTVLNNVNNCSTQFLQDMVVPCITGNLLEPLSKGRYCCTLFKHVNIAVHCVYACKYCCAVYTVLTFNIAVHWGYCILNYVQLG